MNLFDLEGAAVIQPRTFGVGLIYRGHGNWEKFTDIERLFHNGRLIDDSELTKLMDRIDEEMTKDILRLEDKEANQTTPESPSNDNPIEFLKDLEGERRKLMQESEEKAKEYDHDLTQEKLRRLLDLIKENSK